MFPLNEPQHDAITEIFNIGVGRAAATMSQMVNDEILLSVPSIKFLSRVEAARRLSGAPGKVVSGVVQRFSGCLNTNALLMFPEDKSLELVRLLVGDEIPLTEMSELEQEAMTEIGNIILNSCVGTLGNLFGCEFKSSLPSHRRGTFAELIDTESAASDGDDVVMLLFIDFTLEKNAIHGHMAFLMDVPSFQELTQHIDHFIGRSAA